jgi:Eco57I restriction-modification methylase/TaqI-like C-terminal specificity domain
MQTCLFPADPEPLAPAERGAVYTKPVVVGFILDLVGYQTSAPLHRQNILEPACGHGEFLVAIIDRLLASFRCHGGTMSAALELSDCIRAIEADPATAEAACQRVIEHLQTSGVSPVLARQLAERWIVGDDFLLTDALTVRFDYVVGNPPYVRLEQIPAGRLARYRQNYATFANRADLYVPFFERGLSLLGPHGRLCYICSDRWMKCAYGKSLRALVSRDFHLHAYVDMVGTDAFQDAVIAYPAITLLGRRRANHTATRASYRPRLEEGSLRRLATSLSGQGTVAKDVQHLERVTRNGEPYLLDHDERLAAIRRLEAMFPLLEEAGCTVGIGVATGCDRVFIQRHQELDVEPERKMPLVMADDIRTGRLDWTGHCVLNPFEPDGRIAELAAYPRFARYVAEHADALRTRHIAKRAGDGWYRTIDRIWHDLAQTPKLLIPDIKGEANVVLEQGRFYPHHNLYWVTATDWELPALQCILRSTVARAFVATYCVKMAGGFLRFQAQYLRRIRIPAWASVSLAQRSELADCASSLDQGRIDAAACDLYGLSPAERAIFRDFHIVHRPTTAASCA